ncbi:MAG: hypothetical protein K0S47_3310 [Herbinix sp.]|jgi:preprotein translocase subunit SecG|nr:hypothetical protein [Herbinix sp.]
MEILRTIVNVVYIIVCAVLSYIVLRQQGKGYGLSGALTGASSETFWGKNKGRSEEGMLNRITRYLAAAFIILSVVLNLKW